MELTSQMTRRPEQIFLSAVTIGELQDGVELTRKQDAAKASEIESWLSALEMSFAFVPNGYLLLSGMVAAHGRKA